MSLLYLPSFLWVHTPQMLLLSMGIAASTLISKGIYNTSGIPLERTGAASTLIFKGTYTLQLAI